MMASTNFVDDTDESRLSIALKSDLRRDWMQEIKTEMSTIMDNGTFIEGRKPSGKDEIVPSGFILKVKRDASGSPVR